MDPQEARMLQLKQQAADMGAPQGGIGPSPEAIGKMQQMQQMQQMPPSVNEGQMAMAGQGPPQRFGPPSSMMARIQQSQQMPQMQQQPMPQVPMGQGPMMRPQLPPQAQGRALGLGPRRIGMGQKPIQPRQPVPMANRSPTQMRMPVKRGPGM